MNIKAVFTALIATLILAGCSLSQSPDARGTVTQESASGSSRSINQIENSTGWTKITANPDPFASFHVKESDTEEKIDRDELNSKQEPITPISLYPAVCSDILQARKQTWTGMIWADRNYRDCMLRAAIDSKNLHYCMDAWFADRVFLDQCVNTLVVRVIKQNIAKNWPKYPKNFCKDISKELMTPKTMVWIESEQLLNESSSPYMLSEKCYVTYAALSDSLGMCSKNSGDISEMEHEVPGIYSSDYNEPFLKDCRLEVVWNGKIHEKSVCDGISDDKVIHERCVSYLGWKRSESWYWNLTSPFERIPSSEQYFDELKEVQKDLATFKKKINGYDDLLK